MSEYDVKRTQRYLKEAQESARPIKDPQLHEVIRRAVEHIETRVDPKGPPTGPDTEPSGHGCPTGPTGAVGVTAGPMGFTPRRFTTRTTAAPERGDIFLLGPIDAPALVAISRGPQGDITSWALDGYAAHGAKGYLRVVAEADLTRWALYNLDEVRRYNEGIGGHQLDVRYIASSGPDAVGSLFVGGESILIELTAAGEL